MVNTTQPTANLAPATAVKKIQDERLREVSLLTKIMRRPELGAAGRSRPGHDLLSLHRRFVDVHPRGHHEHPLARVAARHPRHRGGAPDDRRRVRSLHRLDGGLHRPRLRRLHHAERLAPARRHRSDLRRGGRARRPERADRHPHAAALLHRHARLPVHPARPLARRAEMGDRRLDADARHRRSGGRGPHPRAVLRRRLRGRLLLARRA